MNIKLFEETMFEHKDDFNLINSRIKRCGRGKRYRDQYMGNGIRYEDSEAGLFYYATDEETFIKLKEDAGNNMSANDKGYIDLQNGEIFVTTNYVEGGLGDGLSNIYVSPSAFSREEIEEREFAFLQAINHNGERGDLVCPKAIPERRRCN